jgi:1-acyl-sn-glycerol-3-phosphate acyltransferase
MVATGEHGHETGRDVAVPGAGARSAELRQHLPGLEPDRQVSDWGRSEFVDGVLDRTVYEFLYHYWFRVEVEGVENIPAEGPAMLVANHAGTLPVSATMVAKAIHQRHRAPRPVHFATERTLGSVPWLDMLLVKAGGVTAHPANLHRLLFDERQLVLVFPEDGRAGPLRHRYRVRRFGRPGLLETALRARAAIVPVAVLGAEEALPVIGRLPAGPLRRLPRLPLAAVLPLPAKLRIRFLEPVPETALARYGDLGQQAAQGLGADVRALIQENLLEMLAQRRSVWLG